MSHDTSPVTPARLAQNSVFERLARAGYVVNGLLHLIVGYLAIRIACGEGGTADQTGALATLATKPGGPVVLWVATAALLTLGLWRLVETAFGRSSDRESQGSSSAAWERAKAFGLAAVYLAFAYSALGFARGAGQPADRQNSSVSARLMQTTAGTLALIACGVIIVAVGVYHIYKGASCNFVGDLKGKTGDLVRRLGAAGYVAKGVVIAGTGALVVVAACSSEPKKATGLDGALKTLGAQPYGPALLVAAGLGIITYGLYSFVMARSNKM
ncbi:DUF1206 domain-containing protein [Mycobacterium sp. 852002-51057_SCH5723018]|uniref:DUF1206 domain-containing protein n=1 Tax=Mycobacterium sp. 852002-51057_SCH5723018 TaxID=1834094 RepID=UPI000800CDF9|nr:DUF1206 domain-containing protein [Mycobacterium sp. 852002-51057_SCH5723018]OBG25138.1 hypothetical protein A5764_06960 [Mycobacterium sp. 852002-51057_SCH5723018]